MFLALSFEFCILLSSASLQQGCIERIPDLTPSKFKAMYQFKRPVILTAASQNSQAREKWTPDRFVANFGHAKVNTGNYLELSIRGQGSKKMTLREYANSGMPGYIFDQSFFKQKATGSLKAELQFVDFLSYGVSPILSFGKASTGLTFHVHHDSTLELFAGRKTWVVYPPNTRLAFSSETLQDWLENKEHATKDVCIFTQVPGEIVYVPEGWYHATSNDENLILGFGHHRCTDDPTCPIERDSFLFAYTLGGQVLAQIPTNAPEFALAMDVIDKARKSWPNEANFLFYLAHAHHRLGLEEDDKTARRLLRKGLELDPENIDVVMLWSQICAEQVTARGPLSKRQDCMKHINRIQDKFNRHVELMNLNLHQFNYIKRTLGLTSNQPKRVWTDPPLKSSIEL